MVDKELFDKIKEINSELLNNNFEEAQNKTIFLLDQYENNGEKKYPLLLNELIRSVGLYPYMDLEHLTWQQSILVESYTVNNGKDDVVLHREQSLVLKKLLDGASLAISASTSFGKSFIIDTYIKIKDPKNVFILVPTIALMDETRRRLNNKFGRKYKIITTPNEDLAQYNIFIFPQERAAHYIDKVDFIDILIIDEFYKISSILDKERSSTLQKVLIGLSEKAKQKYFLAPNVKIRDNEDSILMRGMETMSLNFKTVAINEHHEYKKNRDKDYLLLDLINKRMSKTLIYAGTYSAINEVLNIFNICEDSEINPLLDIFSNWLERNYGRGWLLPRVVKKGVGIHNGSIHRCLGQIQLTLFERIDGLNYIVSTSSIIEGINTSAENVIIWKSKDGLRKINSFQYKNIVGRSGRMFKYFVGNVYILEKPPEQEELVLNLSLNPDLFFDLNEDDFKSDLTDKELKKILQLKKQLIGILGKEDYLSYQKDRVFEDSGANQIIRVAKAIIYRNITQSDLRILNSDDPSKWLNSIAKILHYTSSNMDVKHTVFAQFVAIASNSWKRTIPDILEDLSRYDISIELFFKLEKKLSYNFSSLLNDINKLQKKYYGSGVDISPFIFKISNCFLPVNIYLLEEYGLPRFISRKIINYLPFDLEDNEMGLNQVIDYFRRFGLVRLLDIEELDEFDKYVIQNFFEGIRID